jgi:NDP-sugar pyrophosphorylase family protein
VEPLPLIKPGIVVWGQTWEALANAIEEAPSSEMFFVMQGDKICVLPEAITGVDDFL